MYVKIILTVTAIAALVAVVFSPSVLVWRSSDATASSGCGEVSYRPCFVRIVP